ncbi:MAG: site-2 protease family protein [Eubacterium sp.]|jgi:Zn-dependent protease|nr:site-2 protease family protein [Eubacterium sp.]
MVRDLRGPLLKLISYFGDPYGTPIIEVIISFFVMFLIIFMVFPIHECAHALTAKWLGDDTAERQGRVTLNPFAHIDFMGVMIMLLFPFGYARPVEVNPMRFNKKISMKGGMAITAAAGPVSNILISYLLLIIFKIIYYSNVDNISMSALYVCFALDYAVRINIYLAVFNLIPVPPLDGSKILFAFLNNRQAAFVARYEGFIRMALFAIILFTNVLLPAISFMSNGIYSGLDFLSGFIGHPQI